MPEERDASPALELRVETLEHEVRDLRTKLEGLLSELG